MRRRSPGDVDAALEQSYRRAGRGGQQRLEMHAGPFRRRPQTEQEGQDRLGRHGGEREALLEQLARQDALDDPVDAGHLLALRRVELVEQPHRDGPGGWRATAVQHAPSAGAAASTAAEDNILRT